VFVGGWFVGGALEPHFSQVRQYISELGRIGAANPWIFAIFMAVWGLGWIALAAAVVPSLRTRPWPPELYPEVVDACEGVGGVPSRLLKTDAGVGRQEGTPCQMFAGSPSGRTIKGFGSRLMISLGRARGG
jgi:hypothetical protein